MKLRTLFYKFKKYLSFILIYLTVAGAYTFTAFIIEEAEQQVIWGTWPAQDAKNWELVLEGCDILDSLNTTMKWINWSIGYIQPLALISYHCYWQSTSYYIKSLKTKVFAKSPASFDGRYIEFMFTPKQIVQQDGKIFLVNGRIWIEVDERPITRTVEIKGIVKNKDNIITVRRKE